MSQVADPASEDLVHLSVRVRDPHKKCASHPYLGDGAAPHLVIHLSIRKRLFKPFVRVLRHLPYTFDELGYESSLRKGPVVNVKVFKLPETTHHDGMNDSEAAPQEVASYDVLKQKFTSFLFFISGFGKPNPLSIQYVDVRGSAELAVQEQCRLRKHGPCYSQAIYCRWLII